MQAMLKELAVRSASGNLVLLPTPTVRGLRIARGARCQDRCNFLHEEVMNQNEKRLLTASRWWSHDAKVIENICTDSAQCALLAEWTTRCMPSVERCIDVAASVTSSKKFMQSTSFGWAAHGVKSQVKACHA
eukprot:5740086-Amphidinium_carterae.3